MADARLTVSRRSGFVGSASNLRVILDDDEIGELAPGETLTVETSPGHHELYVTTDGRVRSQHVALEIAAGSTAQALCASPRNPVVNLYRIIFRPSHTIALSVG